MLESRVYLVITTPCIKSIKNFNPQKLTKRYTNYIKIYYKSNYKIKTDNLKVLKNKYLQIDLVLC